MHLKLRRQINKHLCILGLLACLTVPRTAAASEYHGQVIFAGLPVPGATVTATQGSKKFTTVTDQTGVYAFADLPDGTWTIQIELSCFAPLKQDITVAPNEPTVRWELKLLPADQILAQTKIIRTEPKPVVVATAAPPAKGAAPTKPGEAPAPEAPKASEEAQEKSADGFLINGSVNNAATSQFTLAPAFGNRRSGTKSLYTGSIGAILGNSALDARPFSIAGLDSPKASYNRATGVFTFGGPINIPHLLHRGPNFFVAYQWTRDSNATVDPGIVPTLAQRALPATFQAQQLLKLYPLPNLTGNPAYNYQVPVLSNVHQDSLQSRLDKTIGNKTQIYGGFAFQSTRSDNSNLFLFRDTTATLGINSNINWVHRLRHGVIMNTSYKFSRVRTQLTPFFANRVNVLQNAQIPTGDLDPNDWGPPTLQFSSGIATLSDAQSARNRNQTDALSESISWNHGHHYVTFGGDYRRQKYNFQSQQNPRGSFSFTGTTDFAHFLQGNPDTTSVNYGNADKYFRQSVYDAFVSDDWRLRPELTINVGLRWEYGAPLTELFGRLVNLDVANNFSATAPVLATNPVGTLTGQKYPNSLIRPDRRGIEPRVAISWRPIPGSSMVVRAGYGVYQDTSVYTATTLQLAEQTPLTTSFSLDRTKCAVNLSNPFNCASSSTFAVDPNFRVGYAQTWQLSVQRDLPFALQMTGTYLGIKGTRGVQEFLPNTNPTVYPATVPPANPCPSGPCGFVYRSSNGNSTRESGTLQLRRRLRSGFTANLQYTYSKSIDDDSTLGGQGPVAPGAGSQAAASPYIAQDWRNLRAERGLSTFDQRHLLTLQGQYTTGMGIGGGTLLSGWRGTALKEWTVVTQITTGSGLPETPIYFATVAGTGVTGNIRPTLTGAPLSINGHPNSAAFLAPPSGQWGNARRGSIDGPSQFSLNASLSRTFRLDQRLNLDVRVDSTNLLNHVVISSWNNIINSSQFGSAAAANPMRSLQTTMRVRF